MRNSTDNVSVFEVEVDGVFTAKLKISAYFGISQPAIRVARDRTENASVLEVEVDGAFTAELKISALSSRPFVLCGIQRTMFRCLKSKWTESLRRS